MAARVGKYLLFETLGEGAFGKYVLRVPMPSACEWVWLLLGETFLLGRRRPSGTICIMALVPSLAVWG